MTTTCHRLSRIIVIVSVVFLQFGATAQQEVELRTDGIVVPRTTIADVSIPTEGMLIYDTISNGLLYYDGAKWLPIKGSFERVNGLVRQSTPLESSDNFVFGSADLPTEASQNDNLFFFNQDKGAFRGGLNNFGTWAVDSLGEQSFAYGASVTATGDQSVALGSFSRASGFRSTAIGTLCKATGPVSTAIGVETEASGDRSISLGSDTKASGVQSTAFGVLTEASGLSSTAFGLLTKASGTQSTAFGRESEASGQSSTAFGRSTSALGQQSVAAGASTTALGVLSATFGNRTRAWGQESFVIGRYNDTIVSPDAPITPSSPLFIIGNGDSFTSGNNAMVVRKNGEVSFDNYTFPIDDGNSSQVLSTDGNGQLDWLDVNWTNDSNGISTSSNVGIGQAAGSSALTVSANSETSATLTLREEENDFARIAFENTTGSQEWIIAGRADGNNNPSSAALNFFYSGVPQPDNRNVFQLLGNGDAILNNRVGIGRSPATTSTNQLEVEGTASKTTAGSWMANSDRRIKTDIQDIKQACSTITKLRPVKFKYTEEWQRRHPSITGDYYYNFVAQEFREIFPNAVTGSGEYLEGDDEEILQVDTYNTQIVTIAALQELISENEEQQKRIKELESEISEIRALLDQVVEATNATGE